MKLFQNALFRPAALLFAPVAGTAIPLREVRDPVFSGELLGPGAAVCPDEGRIFAPCDGRVAQMFSTGHAVTLTADCGAEVLIHVGIDTVRLEGRHFTPRAADGDRVRKGDLLIEFDLDALRAEGYDPTVAIVVCSSPQHPHLTAWTGRTVRAGDPLIELRK